jgi:hypothetical protein
MYDLDLINLQVQVLAGNAKAALEVLEINEDAVLLSADIPVSRCLSSRHVLSLPAQKVINILDTIGIRENRKVFFTCVRSCVTFELSVHSGMYSYFMLDNANPFAGNKVNTDPDAKKRKSALFRINAGLAYNFDDEHPAFEVLKITDSFIFLWDISVKNEISCISKPVRVLSLLEVNGLLGGRRVFCQDRDGDIYEMLYENKHIFGVRRGHKGIDRSEFQF